MSPKPKLDRCKTCGDTDNLEGYEADGAMGHYPIFWCATCGTLHVRHFSDEDWTHWAPGPKADAACTCRFIQNDDPTRHFRGCPLREKYPTHEVERKPLCAICHQPMDGGFIVYDGADSTVRCDACKDKSFPTHYAKPEGVCGGQYTWAKWSETVRRLRCDRCRMWAPAGVSTRDGDMHNDKPRMQCRYCGSPTAQEECSAYDSGCCMEPYDGPGADNS